MAEMSGVKMAEDVRAEIVASVLEVVVNEGDQIGKGDIVVLLESMKMEIPVLAEVAGNRMLAGELPAELSPPQYPDALRAAASRVWWETAEATLDYARDAYAQRGRLTETAGTIAVAASQAAHAVLAAGGQWVTNEKTLLDRAGLRGVDEILADLTPDAATLSRAVDRALEVLEVAVSGAEAGTPVTGQTGGAG